MASDRQKNQRHIRSGVWSYAILLIILFTIAAIAVYHAIDFIEGYVAQDAVPSIVFLLWTLTLGFMLIAGAFGLWAIQFAGATESRRSVGRFVDEMDFFHDGLLLVDRKGRIRGSNPTAQELATCSIQPATNLFDAFPWLIPADGERLLTSRIPLEVEQEFFSNQVNHCYRFRSQPAGWFTLLVISDVTILSRERSHARQRARLQLIGHLARGVANDFNNLLCGIAAQAALLPRLAHDSESRESSIASIAAGAERGVALASHLINLANLPETPQGGEVVKEHIESACHTLQNSLAAQWSVHCSIHEPLPWISLNGIQLEQIIVNLGLAVADLNSTHHCLILNVGRPGGAPITDVGASYAVVILLFASNQENVDFATMTIRPETDVDGGVIESVIQSMLEESGGKLERLYTHDNRPVFRICFTHGNLPQLDADEEEIPEELLSYAAGLTLLLALGDSRRHLLERQLQKLPLKLTRVDNIASLLAHMEQDQNLDAMIIDERMLGKDASALLRAMVKLRPDSGIVVIRDVSRDATLDIHSSPHVVIASITDAANRLLNAVIQAKSSTGRREPATL